MKMLLAVLGRGCMMESPGGRWSVTRDFDIWELGKMRPEVFPEKNDNDPNSVLGGGELQLAAAAVLHRELDPELTVFAYGNRSPYLEERDYPSESNVMTGIFRDLVYRETGMAPRTNVFNEEEWNTKGSSSYQEIHNMLSLAKKMDVNQIVFLTILVHMNRVLVMMAKHLNDDPNFADLREKIRFEVTESVLLRADAKHYAERILAIFGSQSYLRNLERELKGAQAMYQGVTQTKQLAPAASACP